MWRIPFRDGTFPHTLDSVSSGRILHAAGISPSGGSILHAAVARRGSIHSCEGHFPSSRSSPPATQITVGYGDMFKYWRGDGCHGIGYETLCRFIPILHNFFSGNHLLPSNHKETQPFLPAVQRSADGSSNSLKSTQPHTINQAPEQPPYPSRPEKPAREACAACRRTLQEGC